LSCLFLFKSSFYLTCVTSNANICDHLETIFKQLHQPCEAFFTLLLTNCLLVFHFLVFTFLYSEQCPASNSIYNSISYTTTTTNNTDNKSKQYLHYLTDFYIETGLTQYQSNIILHLCDKLGQLVRKMIKHFNTYDHHQVGQNDK